MDRKRDGHGSPRISSTHPQEQADEGRELGGIAGLVKVGHEPGGPSVAVDEGVID